MFLQERGDVRTKQTYLRRCLRAFLQIWHVPSGCNTFHPNHFCTPPALRSVLFSCIFDALPLLADKLQHLYTPVLPHRPVSAFTVMSHRAFHEMPTELVEAAAGYMNDTDLLSFRLTCRHADAKTLRVVGKRFFTTLKTTLMASDLEKLDGVSRSARLAEYVRAIRIQDDQQKAVSMPSGEGIRLEPEELARLRTRHWIWACEAVGVLEVDKTVVAKLKAILEERLLSLETLAIHYYYTRDGKEDAEATVALAQELILGGKPATTSFSVYLSLRGLPCMGAVLTLYLDRSGQREGLDIRLLQKVGLQLSSGGPPSDHLLTTVSQWAQRLGDLRLECSGPGEALLVDLVHQGRFLPKRTILRFSSKAFRHVCTTS